MLFRSRALCIAPRENRVVAGNDQARAAWTIDAGHADVAAGTLLKPVWYENYPRPVHAWETTGHEAFESKFGLVPLVLPIGIANPVERLYAVNARMRELKAQIDEGRRRLAAAQPQVPDRDTQARNQTREQVNQRLLEQTAKQKGVSAHRTALDRTIAEYRTETNGLTKQKGELARLALDVEYVRTRSLLGDLRILWRTVLVVLRRDDRVQDSRSWPSGG